ncbi:MAG: ATPase [Erythrobacter sp.]|jgi:hypothetical protein|nr:ATPase [Erythrobacter sp.]
MSGRNSIRAVGDGAASGEREEAPPAGDGAIEEGIDEAAWLEPEGFGPEMDPDAQRRFAWVLPALFILALAGWTVFFIWAMRGEIAQAPAVPAREWIGWIIDFSIPCLLIGVVWLVVSRNSRIAAARFAKTAGLLNRESAALEKRVATVNRELSLAREFLAAQSRDLDALGRMATERLSQHSTELEKLIADNSAQVVAIGSVSETALANMRSLREDLPVIASAARDATNQIGSAGRTAHEQLAGLGEGFERLTRASEETDTRLKALLGGIDSGLSDFDERMGGIESALGARFEALRARTESYRSQLGAAEDEALGALRERMALLESETHALGEALSAAGSEAMAEIGGSKERWESEISAMLGKLDELDRLAGDAAHDRIRQLRDEATRFDEKLAQRDAKFAEEISRRQDEFDTREAQASDLLYQRLSELDDMLAQRREAQSEETARLAREIGALGEEVTRLGGLVCSISEDTQASRALIGEGVSQVAAQFAAEREAIASAKADLAELTQAGERLVEIVKGGARQTGEELPQAIEVAMARLAAFEAQAQAAAALIASARDEGGALGELLGQANSDIAEADASLKAMRAALAEQSEEAMARLTGLRGGLARLDEESKSYAGTTLDALREAIAALEAAASGTLETLETRSAQSVQALAGRLSEDAVSALERALRLGTAETIGMLEQSAAHASGVGREVTAQLRDQLVKVNELTKNLEQRIARAREQAQEQVDNDFTRRMALITDSLNSASIDITAALSREVADPEWDAYLKGDRGIFTRRAVRLVGSSEARDITELYQSDEAFKANVNRYIHDFEAMLRAMLSTRDGKALSVTVLGSDIGKLYVALAQAIERLRT